MKQTLGIRFNIVMLLICISAILTAACEDDNVIAERSFTFSGAVTDSITGAVIESARVTISDTTGSFDFRTDRTGLYQGVAFASSRPITIFVQKEGYLTQSREITLSHNLTGVDFRMAQ